AQGWSSLRPIQAEACRVLFDTDQHLLIAAGTASGKTEAAFLPWLRRRSPRPRRRTA
ncbi:MAG: DEAD/DEAH box helicase, partial [Burkholderiales bacterium]|nr:DEAD/DEAH box helicase [Burkholderiales bacterium]